MIDSEFNTNLLQASIVDQINANPEYGWKAAINPRFANYTIGQFKRLFGGRSIPESESWNIPVVTHDISINLPKEFDARKQWPKCPTIGKIGDQGHCGCCWAFASVGALSDRFCIHLGKNVSLSVNDPLACCGFSCGSGCTGGFPYSAMNYAKSYGVVTEQCYPYFDTAGCPDILQCLPAYTTPKCVKKCVGGNKEWQGSKHYAERAYKVSSNPKDIMADVYQNGPVSVTFKAYLDFAIYKTGVYKHVTGVILGKHVVKLIGWGTTADGEDYWLLANQWNINWGDQGYVKFKRGTNECGIEREVVAAMPSTKNLIKEVGDSDYARDASI